MSLLAAQPLRRAALAHRHSPTRPLGRLLAPPHLPVLARRPLSSAAALAHAHHGGCCSLRTRALAQAKAQPHTLLQPSRDSRASTAAHIATSAVAQATPAAVAEPESEWLRLPRSIRPAHYDLLVKSDLEALTFHGLVTITVDVTEVTDRVTLNVGPRLKVSRAHVKTADGALDAIFPLEVDQQHERATIVLPHELLVGTRATVAIAFGSDLDNSMAGMYRSTWAHEGKEGFYALTQFEPTAARRAFPSFDEPALKATVNFRMVHRTPTVAVANMPISEAARPISQAEQNQLLRLSELGLDTSSISSPLGKVSMLGEEQDEWSLTSFDTVPKLSTYLIAYGNGPFVHLTSSYTSPLSGDKIDLKIYTTPEYIHQAQFALDCKARVMPEYEKVFGIAYPLPKLDTLVATDFDAGAMENFGLITGRTSIYLVDEKKGGLNSRKLCASVQSHECSHQWFGNITTMESFQSLWLQEGVATLVGEVIILDRCWPEWHSDREFIVSHLARALELDAKRSSHPIQVPLRGENVEAAINEIFDAISYSKGASVLRMLSKMVGEDVFLKGTSIYLKNHYFGNATTDDLWKGISEASGLDVGAIMNNWVLKQGFPVLTVSEEENSITVRQNRFLASGVVKAEEDKTLWYVPLGLKTVSPEGEATVDHKLVLNQEREIKIPLAGAPRAAWKLNADTVGVYRVAYSPSRLALLGQEAAKPDSGFSLEDRVGLVNDAHTLAKAGYGETSGTLSLLQTLLAEPAFLVNSAAQVAFSELNSVWYKESIEVQAALRKFQRAFWGPKAQALGFDGKRDDSVEVQQLRSLAISGAAIAEDNWTIQEIRNRYAASMKGDENAVPADLLVPVYMNAVKYGGEKEYSHLYNVYDKPPTPAHKVASMYGMCATEDPVLSARTIDFLYSGQVKEQDFLHFFRGLSSRPHGRTMLWESTQSRWEQLTTKFAGNFGISRLVESSFDTLTTDAEAEQVEAFFSDKDCTRFTMALGQGLESVRTRAAWLNRSRDNVKTWLQENGYLLS